MRPPARRLTKAELIWLFENKCEAHSMDYASHYDCYLKEDPQNAPFYERVGFLDIEATGLKANWDFMLCYCIKELDGKILGRHLTKDEVIDRKRDKYLVKELIRDMNKFHRLVVYYGRDYRYDVPFVRTRAEKWGYDFPAYRDQWVTDVYDMAKAKLCLHSTRLQHVCDLLGIPSKGHKLDPEKWQDAQVGHQPSLRWIFKHCQEDVISLEGAWKRLNKYTFRGKRSI